MIKIDIYQNQKFLFIKKTQILKYIYFFGNEVNPHFFCFSDQHNRTFINKYVILWYDFRPPMSHEKKLIRELMI